MITGFDVYKFYIRAKLHFKKNDFDMSKTHVKPSVSTFENRNDRSVFDKIAKQKRKKYNMYIISNLLEDPNRYIRDFTNSSFIRMERITSNLTYFFGDFLSKYETKEDLINAITTENSNVKIINQFKEGSLDIEIICILNNIFKLTDKWKEDEIFSFVYEKEINIIEKYSIFFTDYTSDCKKKIINKYDL